MIIKKVINFILKHKIILGINYHRIGENNSIILENNFVNFNN